MKIPSYRMIASIFSYKVILSISCLALLWPFLLTTQGSINKFSLILVGSLFSVGLFSRTVILFLSSPLLIINTIYFHIQKQWGLHQIDSRVEVAIISPGYETYEYMIAYVGFHPSADKLYLFSNIVIFLILYSIERPKLVNTTRIIRAASIIVVASATAYMMPSYYYLNSFISTIVASYHRVQYVDSRAAAIAQHKPKVTCANDIDKLVVIIGEAESRDRMSLYGYERETTPFLNTLEGFHFEAISPTNQTRYSVPMMLTGVGVSNFDAFYHTESIISKLNRCGYESYWISNQVYTGKHESNVTSIALEADHRYFLNRLSYIMAGYDEEVVESLSKIEMPANTKQVFFIHLMGSHTQYVRRYPEGSVRFKDVNIGSNYDNSIYYTDTIIRDIFELFETHEKTTIMFASDHGEVVTETKYGHGFSPTYKDEYRIPLIVWSRSNERIDRIKQKAKGRVINTESFDSIIAFLVGMEEELNLSFNDEVFSLSPSNKIQCSKLPFYTEENVAPSTE